jgi:RNA polymerase sigma-70 factor, ECF subfamily
MTPESDVPGHREADSVPAEDGDLLDLAALRDLAVGVAYRLVGSRTEAEDLAQEAMVRVQAAAARESLRSPEAFTTTVTTRLAIDHLRLARVRREAYVGPWLPEPVLDDPLLGSSVDPGDAVEMADSLSFAFLVVLESLGPVERAAFLLHDVFDLGYPDIAATLDRTEATCRQIVARARRRVAEARPRYRVDPEQHRQVLERFLDAAQHGDVDRLASLLSEDAVLVTDGGSARKAARHPVTGRDRVVRFLRKVGPALLGSARSEVELEVIELNREPGFVGSVSSQPHVAGMIEVDGSGRISVIHWVLNPDKLRGLDPPAGSRSES